MVVVAPPVFQRNRAKALRSAMAPRLGPLLQLCKMATTRLSVQLDKSRGQRHLQSFNPDPTRFRQAHSVLQVRHSGAFGGGRTIFDGSSQSTAASQASRSLLHRLQPLRLGDIHLAIHLCFGYPCLRSADLAPASCSVSTVMIWSSVNRARFISPPSSGRTLTPSGGNSVPR
jgi:hypothetical protein